MTTPTTSLQMYSVDAALQPDLDAGLARLAEIGFTTVEAFAFVDRAPELKAAFDRHGITAKTGHAFLVSREIPLPDGSTMTAPSLEDTFAAAKELGIERVFDPFVAADRWETRESVAEIAEALNAAAEVGKQYGIGVGYHNHDHELRPKIDGKPALQVLAELLDPAVKLELDLFWATAAHVDVVAFLEELGDRIIAVHVKDGPMDREITTAEVPRDQVPAGQGDVPLAAALDAAPWLEYAVIEFDGTQLDIFDAVAGSFAFLEGRGAEVTV